MSEQSVKVAMLGTDEVAKVRALEEKLGDDYVVLAYDKPLEPAELTDEQLTQLKDVEAELDTAYLVAYKKP